MNWFHTVLLPVATLFAVFLGIRNKVHVWKHVALVVGCALMLCGLWLRTEFNTVLLLAGGVAFLAGVPRASSITKSNR